MSSSRYPVRCTCWYQILGSTLVVLNIIDKSAQHIKVNDVFRDCKAENGWCIAERGGDCPHYIRRGKVSSGWEKQENEV
jgi:hypothetical protein